MLFETFGRRRAGVRLLLVNGTSWRPKVTRKRKKDR